MASEIGFMMLGPEEAQTGDVVYIIPGNETPFLLRPKMDGGFTFVGECYIHGMMDGSSLTYLQIATLRERS